MKTYSQEEIDKNYILNSFNTVAACYLDGKNPEQVTLDKLVDELYNTLCHDSTLTKKQDSLKEDSKQIDSKLPHFKYTPNTPELNTELNKEPKQVAKPLPNFKYTPNTPELNTELNKEIKNNVDVYGYKLVKPEYEKEVLSIIGTNKFLNSDGIHIRQPENIEKLRTAGILDLWFIPVEQPIDESFNTNNISSYLKNVIINAIFYYSVKTSSNSIARNIKYHILNSEEFEYLISQINYDPIITSQNINTIILGDIIFIKNNIITK